MGKQNVAKERITTAQSVHPKKLVVCVHGIGEQQDGDTIDRLAGSLNEKYGGEVTYSYSLLVDKHRSNAAPDGERFERQFPCHVRNLKSADADVTLAEVFWADLSRPASGAVGIGLEFIKGVLGLGHLARDNAAAVHGNDAWQTRLVNLLILLLHFVIAPINLLLLVGLASKLVHMWVYVGSQVDHPAEFIICSMVLLAIGLYLLCIRGGKWRQSYLFGYFVWGSLLLAGLLAVLVAATNFADYTKLPSIFASPFQIDINKLKGFDTYLPFLLLPLVAGVVGAIFISAVLTLANVLRPVAKSSPSSLYAFVCGTMLLLWLTFSMAFWSLAAKTAKSLVANGSAPVVSEFALQSTMKLFPAWILLLMTLIGAGVWAWFREFGNGTKWTESQRLLVNWRLSCVLQAGFVAAAIVLLAVILDRLSLPQFRWAIVSLTPEFILDSINKHYGKVTTAFVLVVGIIANSFREGIGQGLGVAKDVITYFKGEPNGGRSSQLAYPLRSQIHGRFKTVLETLVRLEKPSEVHIVAHSLGTVVAVESLKEMQAHPSDHALFSRDVTRRSLTTMGSPITHIFQHYFGQKFEVPCLEGFDTWKNIYCDNDFVGTTIGDTGGTWPVNKPVKRAGHTAYWTDRRTIEHIIDVLETSPPDSGCDTGTSRKTRTRT